MPFAIVEGRAGEELLKGLGEVAVVVEADGERDVRNRTVRLLQQVTRRTDADAQEVLNRAASQDF